MGSNPPRNGLDVRASSGILPLWMIGSDRKLRRKIREGLEGDGLVAFAGAYQDYHSASVSLGSSNAHSPLICLIESVNKKLDDSWNMGYPVTASYSYDEMGRVEWIRYDLAYAGRQLPIQINYWYDYQGNIVKKCFADKADIGNTLYTFYNYDEEGRLSTVSTSQDATGASTERNAKYSYFESNRIRQLTLGSMPAQVIDYAYNGRGWLKSINDPENMGTDKFAMALGYEFRDKIGTVFPFTPQNNGNVSWLVYRMAGVSNSYYSPYYGQVSTDYVGRVFTYDGMNRLTQAPFGYVTAQLQG